MRSHRYYPVPETPADLQRLWEAATPLSPERVPDWLDAGRCDLYRLLPLPSVPVCNADRDALAANLDELRAAGFVIERADNILAARVYVPRLAWGHEWSIGIYAGASPIHLHPSSAVHNPVLTREHVTDVMASFVADPFLVRDGARWFMFLEVMNWSENKGEIGLASSEDGLLWRYERIVIDEPFHLSYPYVFEWNHDYFMTPECHQAGAVRLYRAVRFPWEWQFAGNLLESPYVVDASVFRHEGFWWMFADTSPAARHDTLRLFFAKELTGPWTEHRASPIIEGNPHAARPGGRVQVVDSQLVRFAQDCVPDYGTSLRAFTITELSRQHYSESEAKTDPVLAPSGSGWNGSGMHHMDAQRLDNGQWLASVDGR